MATVANILIYLILMRDGPRTFIVAISAISIFFKDAGYNEAHWLLANEYYSISQVMPHEMEEDIVPEGK